MAEPFAARRPGTIRARVGGRWIEARPNLVDRAVGYFSPTRYLRRMQGRFMTAYAEVRGGYTTKKKSRQLSQWEYSDGDADADLLPDLEDLRESSADLERKNAIAAGSLKTKLTSVVGAGLMLNAQVDRDFLGLSDEAGDELERAMQREWSVFANTVECDLERQSTFRELTRIVYSSKNSRGDVFVLLPFEERPGSPYGLKLQVIEADRVTNPKFEADTDTIAGGIERDPDTGEFVAVWVSDKHPGSHKTGSAGRLRRSSRDFEWTRIPAFDDDGRPRVLHVFDKRRPMQSRGVPDLAPVIEVIKQLGRYTDAEVAAAVVAGMFTVFIKTVGGSALAPMQPTADSNASTTDSDVKLMNGGIVSLMPDEDIESANPGRPNQAFDPFVQALLQYIGTALELPVELLVKKFTSSYSAARAALNEAWKYFITERALLTSRFCQPVYELVIEEAVLRGRIAAPGFLADPAIRRAYLGATWTGPGRGTINEVQEVTAAIDRAENNLSTKAQETAMLNGGDYEANVRTRRREVALERAAGVVPPDSQGQRPEPRDPDEMDEADAAGRAAA